MSWELRVRALPLCPPGLKRLPLPIVSELQLQMHNGTWNLAYCILCRIIQCALCSMFYHSPQTGLVSGLCTSFAVVCCVVLCRAVLCCAVWCCAVLYGAVLCGDSPCL